MYNVLAVKCGSNESVKVAINDRGGVGITPVEFSIGVSSSFKVGKKIGRTSLRDYTD
jgi:hypothetical protein